MNSEGKDDKNHTMVYRLQDITDCPDISLTRGGMILIGLLSGGDYQQGGLNRCGIVTAHGLARCGLGDSLYQAAINLTREQLPAFLSNWRNELRHELRTDSQGHIGRKQPSLAKSVPDDFPDIGILLSYTNPITSETMGRATSNLKLTWDKEPDLGELAATCEFNFEWGYRDAIIKRFRTVIWPSAVLRILRRAVLDADAKAKRCSGVLPKTPQKKGKPGSTTVGTPSKMITKHFSSMTLNSPDLSHDGDDERLIVKIHSTRCHSSTDGILEYRLEIAPAQLVRLTKSGIKGIRRPEDVDEWADEYDEDDNVGSGGKSRGKKPPPHPESHLRVWMPAAMVRIVEPDLVEEYEQIQRRKREKKTGKGRAKATGNKGKGKSQTNVEDEDEESASSGSELPRLKPIVQKVNKGKAIQKSARTDARIVCNDLKTTFAVAKARNYSKPKAQTISAPPKPATVKPRTIPAFMELSDDSDTLPTRWKPQQLYAPKPHPKPTATKRRVKSPAVAFSDGSDDLPAAPGPSQPISSLSKPSKQSKNAYYSVSEPEVVEVSPYRPKVFQPKRLPTNKRSGYACDTSAESESEEVAPVGRTPPQLLQPKPFPMSLNDMFGANDPVEDVPETSFPVAKPKQARKKPLASPSDSDSYQTRLKKSPRKSVDHMSPRSTRIVSHLSRDDRQDDANIDFRPGSPSPLPSRPTRATKISSSRSIGQPGVIEISSDSDLPTCRPMGLPLILAKAKARRKVELSPPQTLLEEYIQSQPKIALRQADLNVMTGDIIDLT